MELLLIFVGFFSIRSNVNFPGWRALLPTLGAVCLIAAGQHAWVNRSILAHPILRKIGIISYPLYLWHWVLLVFVRILKGSTAAPSYRIAAVALAIFLAWATYNFIEKPVRYGSHAKAKTLNLIFVMILIGGLGFQIVHLNGFPDRTVVLDNISEDSANDGGGQSFMSTDCQKANQYIDNLECYVDKRDEPHLALIGDSKAEVLFPALVRTSTAENRWALISKPKFAPLISSAEVYEKHQEAAQTVVEQVLSMSTVNTIAIASATRVTFRLKNEVDILDLPQSQLYQEAYLGLNSFVSKLTAANKNVILLIDNPTLADPKDCLNRQTSIHWVNELLGLNMPNSRCNIMINEQIRLSQLHRNLLAAVAANNPGQVTVFDTLPLLCDTKTQSCAALMNGRVMYSFTDHISDYAAGLVAKALNSSVSLNHSTGRAQ